MLLPYKDINPTRRPPVVTVAIIVINCLVYLYALAVTSMGHGQFQTYIYYLGLVPSRLFSFELFSLGGPVPVALTPFTSMFMHAGLLHLAGNMLYLWIFGNNVEDLLGHARYLVFYLVCGLGASLAHIVISLGGDVPLVGASGAIAGVMGAYFVVWPHARIRSLLFLFIFFTIIELPAVVVLGFWIVFQVLEGMGSIGNHGGGVAFFAHIGGFFIGIALIWPIRKRRQLRSARYFRALH